MGCSCLQYISKVFVVIIFKNMSKYLCKYPCLFPSWPLCPCQVPSLAQGFSELQWQESGLCTLVPRWNENSAHQWAGCIYVHDSAVHLWDRTNSLLNKGVSKWHLKNPVYIRFDSTYFLGPKSVWDLFYFPEQVLMQTCFLPVRNPWGKNNPEIQKDLGWPLVIQLCLHNHTHNQWYFTILWIQNGKNKGHSK